MTPPFRYLPRWTLVTAFGLALAATAACGSDTGPSTSGAAGATTPAAVLGGAPAGTATSHAPADPPGGGDSSSGGDGSGGGMPASWRLCQNPLRGTSMGYPGDWFTTSLTASDACSQFHPTEFTIPVDGEYPRTALNAVAADDSRDAYVASVTSPEFATTVSRTNTTVAGRAATKFEVTSTGAGLSEAGERTYGYVIDRSGRAFVVWTVAAAGETRYSDWKQVVDTAVATLRFL